MRPVSMRNRFLCILVFGGCGDPSSVPVSVPDSVELVALVPTMDGVKVDVEVANQGWALSGAWHVPEWDPEGFGFAWMGEGGGAIALDLPDVEAVTVRIRVRAADAGQTLSVGGQPPKSVGQVWEVLEFAVPTSGLSQLDLVPSEVFRPVGDARTLTVAVDWLEVVRQGAGRLVDRTGSLDLGSNDGRSALGLGWGANEGQEGSDWVWSVGPEAAVTFSGRGGAAALDLRVRPFRWEDAEAATLALSLNGGEARQLELSDDWAVYRVVFDDSEVRAGDNVLRFAPSPIGSPTMLGLGEDDRELGVAVDHILISSLGHPVFEDGGWSMAAGQSVRWNEPRAGDWLLHVTGTVIATCVSGDGSDDLSVVPRLAIPAGCGELVVTATEDSVRLTRLSKAD